MTSPNPGSFPHFQPDGDRGDGRAIHTRRSKRWSGAPRPAGPPVFRPPLLGTQGSARMVTAATPRPARRANVPASAVPAAAGPRGGSCLTAWGRYRHSCCRDRRRAFRGVEHGRNGHSSQAVAGRDDSRLIPHRPLIRRPAEPHGKGARRCLRQRRAPFVVTSAPQGAGQRNQCWCPWCPAPALSFSLPSGESLTSASVVSSRVATEAAFCRPQRTTFVGSITPDATRSS